MKSEDETVEDYLGNNTFTCIRLYKRLSISMTVNNNLIFSLKGTIQDKAMKLNHYIFVCKR